MDNFGTSTLDPTPEQLEVLRILLVRFQSDCEMSRLWPGQPLAGKYIVPRFWFDAWRDNEVREFSVLNFAGCVSNLLSIAWQIDQLRQRTPDGENIWGGKTWRNLSDPWQAYLLRQHTPGGDPFTRGKTWGNFWSLWISKTGMDLIVWVTEQAHLWGIDDLELNLWNPLPEFAREKKDRTDWFYDLLETWNQHPPEATFVAQGMADCLDRSINSLGEIIAGNNKPVPWHAHFEDHETSASEDHETSESDIAGCAKPGRKPDQERAAMIEQMNELLTAQKKNWNEITQIICERFGRRLSKETLRSYYYNRLQKQ